MGVKSLCFSDNEVEKWEGEALQPNKHNEKEEIGTGRWRAEGSSVIIAAQHASIASTG